MGIDNRRISRAMNLIFSPLRTAQVEAEDSGTISDRITFADRISGFSFSLLH